MRIVECQPQLVVLRLIELQHLLYGFLAVVLFHRVRFGIGGSFFALAAYVGASSLYDLATKAWRGDTAAEPRGNP